MISIKFLRENNSSPKNVHKYNSIQLYIKFFLLHTSSRLKRTPPIGAPKATETPAAAAADKISLFFASFLPYLGKR